MSDTITYQGWLVVKVTNLEPSWKTTATARLAKKKPTVTRDEMAMRISVELPRALFVRPALSAEIRVRDSDSPPAEISLDVRDTIEEVLRERTGFDVRVIPGLPEGKGDE